MRKCDPVVVEEITTRFSGGGVPFADSPPATSCEPYGLKDRAVALGHADTRALYWREDGGSGGGGYLDVVEPAAGYINGVNVPVDGGRLQSL